MEEKQLKQVVNFRKEIEKAVEKEEAVLNELKSTVNELERVVAEKKDIAFKLQLIEFDLTEGKGFKENPIEKTVEAK